MTIKTDIELDVTSEEMAVDFTYDPVVADLFEKYEFGSLKKFIGNVQPTAPKEEKKLCFEPASAAEACRMAKASGKVAIITEGAQTGIFTEIRNITVAVCENGAYHAACGSAEDFKDIISDNEIIKYGYDLKLQRNILSHNGINLRGRLMDIELMHYLINPEKSHKVEILAKSYLDINLEECLPEKKEEAPLSLFDEAPEEEAAADERFPEAVATLQLGDAIWKEMEEADLCGLYERMEEPLLAVLSDMEMEGVKIDLPQLRKYASALATEMNEIQERVREMAEEPALNIMSPKQVGILLYEKMNLDPKVKMKGEPLELPDIIFNKNTGLIRSDSNVHDSAVPDRSNIALRQIGCPFGRAIFPFVVEPSLPERKIRFTHPKIGAAWHPGVYALLIFGIPVPAVCETTGSNNRRP